MFRRGRVKIAIKPLFYIIAFLAAIFLGSKSVSAADGSIADHILINELCTKSSCENGEWIELFNPTEESVDSSDYTLEDNNHKPHELNGVLGSGEYTVIYFSGLNDSGDCMILKDKINSTIVDKVFYGDYEDKDVLNNISENAEAPKTNESITRKLNALVTGNNSIDFVPALPTPGSEYREIVDEIVDDPDEVSDETLNIKDTRALEDGEDVIVTGTVTTLPGVLSSQYFYIQDETGGIQVYCYGKNFPTLSLGDVVSVTGELSQINNERRVKISSADSIVILNHTDPVTPTEITISDIGEENEGAYIKTAGIVTETSGNTFYISDGKSEIKVVINKTTGINKPKMKKGDQVEVAGIVSQYKDEYRILPIDQDDVKIVASEDQLPRAGEEQLIYPAIGLFITILWNIFLKAKRKLLKLPAI
ncbi:MAG: lamin tail domain-containing protein [Patescibacteria group bacterium]